MYFGVSDEHMTESISEGTLIIDRRMLHIPALNEFLGQKYFYCCKDDGKNLSLPVLLDSRTFRNTTLRDSFNTGLGYCSHDRLREGLVLVFNFLKQLWVMTQTTALDGFVGGNGAIILPENFVMEPLQNYLQRLSPSDVSD